MTPAQMKPYRELVARAARELGLTDPAQIETYRKRVLIEETGKDSSKLVGPTQEYDAVMRRHAADANDWVLAEQYCGGDEKRMAAMIYDSVRQVGELAGVPDLDRLGYVHGILKQAGLLQKCSRFSNEWWEDYPTTSAKMVFCILDKHRRRLVRRLNTQTGIYHHIAYKYGTKWPTPVKRDAPKS